MRSLKWIDDIVRLIAVELEREEIHITHGGHVVGLQKHIVKFIYNKALQAACEEIKAIQESEARNETRLWPPDNFPWDK